MNKVALGIIVILSPSLALAGDHVLNLMQIYQQSLASDPTWASAQYANLAAQEKLVQGRALTLPSMTLNGSASHSETEIRFIGSNIIFPSGSQQFETYGYSLNFTQPLYRKQNTLQYEQSRVEVAQADALLRNARQQLMLRVSQTYFEVLLAQDRIDLLQAQKAAIGKQLEQAKENFEVGSATIVDVNEAQARHDLTQAQEIAATNELEAKKRAIQSLTGDLPERLAAAKDDLQTWVPEPRAMEDWVAMAEQNNLDLRIKQDALEIAVKQAESAQAGHLPTLDVIASYGQTYANSGYYGFGSDLKIGTLGLQVQVPLYQGGAITSKVREAAAIKEKVQDDVEAARREADLQTRQAYLAVVSTAAQTKAYEQALASSQSQLDSTRLGYEVGVRTSIDVLNSLQQYYSAKRDLLQSRYEWMYEVLRLKAAAGVLNEGDIAETSRQLQGS